MRRFGLPSVLVMLAVLGLGSASHAQEPEDAVYVYDLFHEADNCLALFARLRRLPLRPTVILSVEQGPDFVLDRPKGDDHLSCVLRFLRGSSRQVKGLFLQDPVFLERSQEAVRRAEMLGDFIARHPGELAGVQVDVEPHADAKWEASSIEERRALLQALHDLLRQVRPHLRGLPLSAAIPWWYTPEAHNLPEAAPEALFQVADELYVMLYGDEKEPVVWDPTRLRGWIGRAPALSRSSRIHPVLATYEFPSQARLKAGLKEIRRTLRSRPNFGGTAVFHAASSFRVISRGLSPASQSASQFGFRPLHLALGQLLPEGWVLLSQAPGRKSGQAVSLD